MKQDEESPWHYSPDGKQAVDDLPENNEASPATSETPRVDKSVSWQAPEFIAHPHPPSWYAALVIATIVVAALVFLTTRDFIATGTIAVLGVIVGVSAKRQPGLATYELNNTGLSINNRNYAYSSFKSFSMLPEGEMTSINFFPLKRFMPLVSVYLTKADEAKVTNVIGNHLPYDQREMDPIDRLSRRLRF